MNRGRPRSSPPSTWGLSKRAAFRHRANPAGWSGGLLDNAIVRSVVLVAAGAALLGFVYLAWADSRSGFEESSLGSSLQANPPAQLPLAGSYVDSRILANGDIRIDQWVRTRAPISSVELVVPHGEGPGGAPRATDVDVVNELGDHSVRATVGTSATYRLTYPSLIVRVRYTLVGAVVRSPSAPGRALARFTSGDLVFSPEVDGPERVRIRAPEVLNVACRAPSPATGPRPCGQPAGTSWQVELHGADRADQVSAQVNLGPG
jgi:hypothetical protein